MKTLRNPYTKLTGYRCFGCSPDNPAGLKMRFTEDGEDIVCQWLPGENFHGYHHVVHGGIQATLLDEAGSWVVQTKGRTAGLTSSMQLRYHKPVSAVNGSITVKARLDKMLRNIAVVKGEIFNHEGILCTEAEIRYFTFPPDKAAEMLAYPGYKAFYDEQ
jgi:uncharacterized protein (TIGR00369 family)